MKTHIITESQVILHDDTFLIDSENIENAEIILAENITVHYTLVSKNPKIFRHIKMQNGVQFEGNSVLVEDCEATIITEPQGDNVRSILDILAVATDGSKISVEGIARVDNPHQDIFTRVDQTNILIGKNVSVRGVPQLEIATNGAEGGHSCKIHRLGGDAIFYLQSHGLNAKNAETLLLKSEILRHLSTLPENEKEKFCSIIHKSLAKNKK